MLTVTGKRQMLEEAGYAYSFDRLSYINREAQKVFSLEFIEDHSEDDLRRRIGEPTPNGDWVFYFNAPPSEAVKREFAASIRR